MNDEYNKNLNPQNENPEEGIVTDDTEINTDAFEEIPQAEENAYADNNGAENVQDASIEEAEAQEENSEVISANEEIPVVEAQQYSQPENPVYTQQAYTNTTQMPPQAQYAQPNFQYNGNPNQSTYYYSPNGQQIPQQPATPSAKPKKQRKGLKAFAACLAIVVVFALGFGIASVAKGGNDNGGMIGGTTKADIFEQNNNSPELNINESPVSPTAVQVEGALTTAQIAEKVKPSIVGVVVYTQNSNSSAGEGTGIVMSYDEASGYTYIITCAHVISDSGIKVRIQTEDGTTYDADIVGFDTRTDLGVVRIKAKGLAAAEFGDSNSLKVGDSVYAIGNPGGVEFFGSFTGGFVSAIDRPVNSEIGYTMKCIQHDAAINPGNSGGALVNVYGQVIGINSQKIAASDYEGMGFAIPITSAKEIIDDLIKYNYVPNRPQLGITYYPVSASQQYSMIAQIKGLPAGTLIINKINADSSLANTNVKQYDMITAVNGKPLTTADVLLEKIDNGKVGDKMTLSICRVNGDYSIEEFDVEITLVEDKGGSEPIETTAYYIDPFDYFQQFGY